MGSEHTHTRIWSVNTRRKVSTARNGHDAKAKVEWNTSQLATTNDLSTYTTTTTTTTITTVLGTFRFKARSVYEREDVFPPNFWGEFSGH